MTGEWADELDTCVVGADNAIFSTDRGIGSVVDGNRRVSISIFSSERVDEMTAGSNKFRCVIMVIYMENATIATKAAITISVKRVKTQHPNDTPQHFFFSESDRDVEEVELTHI